MNKKIGWVIGALVIALLAVGVFGTTSALADDGDTGRPFGGHGGHGPGDHTLDGAALEAVAGVLNMEPDEVTAALEDGMTLCRTSKTRYPVSVRTQCATVLPRLWKMAR